MGPMTDLRRPNYSRHPWRPNWNHGQGPPALLRYICTLCQLCGTGASQRCTSCVGNALPHFRHNNMGLQTPHSDKVGSTCAKGTSIHLKSKFGKGYTLKITLAVVNDADNIKRIITEATGRGVEEEASTHLSFNFQPSDEATLPNLFRALEEEQQALGIDDLQLSMSTLEDVFLDVIKKAEAEEGSSRMVTVTLPSGTQVQVTAGQEGPIQTSEGPVTVTWGLDDEGSMTAVHVAASSQMQSMSVTVPQGLSGGSSVAIATPQGTVATVAIPQGLSEGDTFVAEVPIVLEGEPAQLQDGQTGDACRLARVRVKQMFARIFFHVMTGPE